MGIKLNSTAGKAVLKALGGRPPGKRDRSPEKATIAPGWVVTLELDCRLYSTANRREHWSVKRRKAVEQRAAFDRAVMLAGLWTWHPDRFPLQVTITHQTDGTLMDDDNLTASAKALRDHVARWLGVGDSPDDPVAWSVEQCPGVPGTFVRIEPWRARR